MNEILDNKLKYILEKKNIDIDKVNDFFLENGIEIDLYSEKIEPKYLTIIESNFKNDDSKNEDTKNDNKENKKTFELKHPNEKVDENKSLKCKTPKQYNIFTNIDIVEEDLYNFYPELLDMLLKDRTSGKNIIWATKDYANLGKEFNKENEIKPELIMGEYKDLIQPRHIKDKSNQSQRTKDRAEVFTPSWVCNKQNNLVDNAWFDAENLFNEEDVSNRKHIPHYIESKKDKIEFKNGKTWEDYVLDTRLEITCGEAPYLVSRYDTVTGEKIQIYNQAYKRIGLLDRKLRVICENIDNNHRIDWMTWTKKAYESIYGYEFQGDNVLLAREALLATFYEYYHHHFGDDPKTKELLEIAEIISWNIWQMDGITMCPPYEEEKAENNMDELDFDNGGQKRKESNYSVIMNWTDKKIETFKSSVSE